ncbi:arsenite efflux membrane protein ArsB [Branchiibius hedensis]|uniref:Arsenite efflux membrane protein ArsB n=1 Tax=Branchiibius hedensis TaxID=672460 RepID=A0A2Y8ZSP1_9MICO|nr:SLC13 family permease [Branchiibius hedensis]PWJ26558.1 arsenite efflux membrane protein ArsB [Branchiibius hedensis]SSA35370.1 arsenite efflux membrane protein ArsB [Branchiibius hedensis]
MLSAHEVLDLAARVGPVLVFLVAITVVAEIASIAGVFDVAAHWAARAGGRRTWRLWLLIVALACVSTIVLSLDTTAVLLTPVAITVAAQVGVSPVPFAMTTLWLANTASLLLPVSNLTNLLALHHVASTSAYLRLSWAPALAAIAATVLVLALRHRRVLRGTYDVPSPPSPHDRVLLWSAGCVCVLLGPLFVTGLVPAVPATVAAVFLAVVLFVRDRSRLREIAVPWRLVVGVVVLFLVVQLALDHGLRSLLGSAVGSGVGTLDLFRLAFTGGVSANLVNNLPAYLALESVASDAPARLIALLIGVNAGPLVTVWASLATLLWRQRCRAAGLSISTRRLALEGFVAAVASVAAATVALVVVA